MLESHLRRFKEEMCANLIRLMIFASVMVIALPACGRRESFEQREAKIKGLREELHSKEEADRARLLAVLREQYRAHEWDSKDILWTADLQERLIPTSGQAIVGIARLRDVEKADDSHVIQLVSEPSIGGFHIEFHLMGARPDKPGKASGPGASFADRFFDFPEYVFAARIQRLNRIDVVRNGDLGPERQSYWLAEGECLALYETPTDLELRQRLSDLMRLR
jgi:hypothetical protein